MNLLYLCNITYVIMNAITDIKLNKTNKNVNLPKIKLDKKVDKKTNATLEASSKNV